jgi:hypothetical protein
MEFKLNIEKPIDIGQLDQEFRAIFGDTFIGLNGDENVLAFIFSPDAKVTEDAVVAILFEHTPKTNTAEQERNEALMQLFNFTEENVTPENVVRITQQLMSMVAAFRKIYFG